jgi:hypothetical protein
MKTDWPFSDLHNVAVFTTRSLVEGGAWIALVTHDAEDGSWQFHDDAPRPSCEDDVWVVSLQSMVLRDQSLNDLADFPKGWRAWRDAPTAPWQRVPRASSASRDAITGGF